MNEISVIIILTIAALLVSWGSFIPALRYAHKNSIVDKPDARKLQREPVPVLGGIPVALGIFIPICIAWFFFEFDNLWYALIVMFALSVMGVIDDIVDINAKIRFCIEVILVWFMLSKTEMIIQDLHGLFGIGAISIYVGLPLSVFAGVGIINSMNMIDGVDGYSSGFGIMANILFASVFFRVGDIVLGLFSLIASASLLPFFVHNVFGKKSKMYIGDGGSLLIGMVMVWDVFALLAPSSSSEPLKEHGICLVAMVLAVLCIPVFDTLRVMFSRIFHKQSPFSPDRTHLHHMFLNLGFSHVGTSFSIILLNIFIVLVFQLSVKLGASDNLQFIIVCVLGLLFSCGIYYGMDYLHRKQTGILYKALLKVAGWTQFENRSFWKIMERIADFRCQS